VPQKILKVDRSTLSRHDLAWGAMRNGDVAMTKRTTDGASKRPLKKRRKRDTPAESDSTPLPGTTRSGTPIPAVCPLPGSNRKPPGTRQAATGTIAGVGVWL
jgi:hypothetical protein